MAADIVGVLKSQGYVDISEASRILDRGIGGDMPDKLRSEGIPVVTIPYKTGTKKRWFFGRKELEQYAAKINATINEGGDSGGKLAQKINYLAGRIDALENDLHELKQSLGE